MAASAGAQVPELTVTVAVPPMRKFVTPEMNGGTLFTGPGFMVAEVAE
ncbi:unannotated protein [freshwater metagenome]|uniref:Unannotated protein n=1 Tax=freshwater metagenome TaxID=449393 RepID=A0A6J6GSH4_9ZZZZ